MAVFVGRAGELQHLEQHLERALQGHGKVVFLTGEAGAGKSSLVKRFLIDAALHAPEARIIGADCSEQYGAGEPYQPFVEALRDLLAGGDAGTKQRPRFRDLARELAPHWIAAIPVAGDILAATAATAVELKESLGGGTATAAPPSEEALFFQYTELLLAAAQEHPVVLFIDDLHWADHATVSLLGHIGRKIADKPVLILGTYRPADVDVAKHPIKQAKLELERYGVAEEVRLSTLASDDLRELIAEELEGRPAPDLVDWLEDVAGSNPLFFTELLRWAVDQGVAEQRHGEWVLARVPEAVEIPRSAESAIEKRLNRLDPEVYKVLEYASVEGDEFDSVVLSRLLDMDELELEETLEPLSRVHALIELSETRDLPNGDLASVYEFSHSLFQDVLHRNLQGKRRILLHRKVASILEEIYASDTSSIAHKLAVHYDEGRVRDRAYEFALRAAERARTLYAHRDAIELLERALRNSESEGQKLEAFERLGEEHQLVGHYPDARTFFDKALESAATIGEGIRQVDIKRKKIELDRDYGQRTPEALYSDLKALVEEARSAEASRELCHILWAFRGLPAAEGGEDFERAALREALGIAEGIGEPEFVAKAHYTLGALLMFGEDRDRAEGHLQEALQLYEELEDTNRVGSCRNCLAIVNLLQGDYASATEHFNASASAFDEVGDPINESLVRNNLGILLTRRGEWEEAEANLEEAWRIAQRIEAAAWVLPPLENFAELYEAKGDRETARKYWTDLLEKSRETGYWNAEVAAHCGLGLCKLDEDDVEGAKEKAELARNLLEREPGWTDRSDRYHLLAARLAARRGDKAGAVQHLERGERALAARDQYKYAVFRLTHAEVLGEGGGEEAISAAEDALRTFEALGAEPLRKSAEDLLARLRGNS